MPMASGTHRVGLRDIAEATNLSITTVSRVLSDKTPQRFPPETRDRVMEAAAKLNYRPNILAVAARGGKSRTVGVFLPPYDQFWTEVMYGVHDELLDHAHVPLSLWPTHIRAEHARPSRDQVPVDRISELSQLQRMVDRAVDGLILWPVTEPDAGQFVEELALRGMPVVGIDHRPVAGAPCMAVGTDEEHCANLVADHLLGLGHRSFVHLAGPRSLFWADRRASYFERRIAAEDDAWCVVLPEQRAEVTARALTQLLMPDPKITAVYAATDELARIATSVIRQAGPRAGADIAIVSVGDTGFAEGAQITSIRQRPYDIGKAAARLALNPRHVVGSEAQDMDALLPPELVIRESTGGLSPSDGGRQARELDGRQSTERGMP